MAAVGGRPRRSDEHAQDAVDNVLVAGASPALDVRKLVRIGLALGAAVVLDLLLLVSFGWSELIGQSLRNTLWVAFGVFWVVAAGWSVRQCRRRAAAGKS